MAASRAIWRPLIVDGGWNPILRRAFDRSSGAYAIRERATGVVVYVGESNMGRGWRTLTRHFQDPSGKFAAMRETFTSRKPEDFDGAVWVTSRGARGGKGDQRAMDLQAELIARYRKQGHELVNVDDGRAKLEALRTSGRDRRLASHAAKGAPKTEEPYVFEQEEEGDAFGDLLRENPPAVPPPNVAPEKRAENRTPDLFTGKTKLEEGGKGARRDWKGEAERLARELAACKAAAPSTETPPPDTSRKKIEKIPQAPPKPPPELDARGQATMFRRNPGGGLVVLGELVSIRYRPDKGRATTMRWGTRRPPLVAYSPAGRLVLVFDPCWEGRASSSAARKEYARTHWGKKGPGTLQTGKVLGGKARRLGTALEITYATEKGGDAELVNYWHKFGEIGDGKMAESYIPPALVAAKCAGCAMVRLDGGTYRVTERGIVG